MLIPQQDYKYTLGTSLCFLLGSIGFRKKTPLSAKEERIAFSHGLLLLHFFQHLQSLTTGQSLNTLTKLTELYLKF